MALNFYGDFISQPSRAVLIFIKVNNIDVIVHKLDIFKGEQKAPEYLKINPNGMVPAIVEADGFKLFESSFDCKAQVLSMLQKLAPNFFLPIQGNPNLLSESHTIMRYLASTRSVPDHWYPSDPKKRAIIDSILDWHHTMLRQGARPYVVESLFVQPKQEEVISKAKVILEQSLSFIEANWLDGEEPFLASGSGPSIADLALVSEIKELVLLDQEEYDATLGHHGKITKWIKAVQEATEPHFTEIHEYLETTATHLRKQRSAKS